MQTYLRPVALFSLFFLAAHESVCLSAPSAEVQTQPPGSETAPADERPTGPFDHSIWDQFLKTYVNDAGEVDYAGVKAHPELLQKYLEVVGSIRFNFFQTWLREEILALFMNLYHAVIILAVSQHYPVGSINDIPGIWDIEMVYAGQAPYSLNKIRDEMLIKTYRDEKIHLALSCGAKSCPRLQREAFTGPRVEGQLFLATREFVNNPDQVSIVPEKKQVQLSRIFLWHGKDFQLDFGALENDRNLPAQDFAVLSFLYYYLEDTAKITFLDDGKFKIKYLPFDWNLNDWKRTPAGDTPEKP